MDQVKLIEAYACLKSLRQHAPGPYVHEKYVTEFHRILDLLEEASPASLANFRIPATEVKLVTALRRRGKATYSDEPHCEGALFQMRVDGVLAMFELLLSSASSGKEPIGFNPPKS